MALVLAMDPSQIETGSAKAKAALEKVALAAKQSEEAIEYLRQEGGRFAPAMAQTASAAERVGTQSMFAGGQARMLGQQLSQVAQQGAATGQWAQAFSIQMADIGMSFGGIGVAAGILATVSVPLIMQAFGSTKSAADELGRANDVMSDSLDRINRTAKQLSQEGLTDLKDKYGQVNTALVQMLQTQTIADQKAAMDAARAAVKALTDEYGNMFIAIQDGGMMGEAAQAQLSNSLGLSADRTNQLKAAIDAANDAEDFSQWASALHDINAVLIDSSIATSDLAQGTRDAENNARQLSNAMGDAATATMAVVSSAPGAGWLSGAIGDARALAAALWDASAGLLHSGGGGDGGFPAMQGPAGMGSAPAGGGAVATSARPGRRGVDSVTFGGGSSGGGGGGGGRDTLAETQRAYDALMASIDPVIDRTQKLAKAQATINAELATGRITAEEAANAYAKAAAQIGDMAGQWDALNEAGGNAIDRLIDGTSNLSDALKDMAKDLIFATIKAQILQHVTGGNAGMSLGGLIMQGITGGFHDAGGMIPSGTTGVVGERGPELVRATSSGALVTSRVETARGGSAQQVHVMVSVDDTGGLQAYVKNAAGAAAGQAVETVKRNLSGWNNRIAMDGALV